MQKLTGGAGIDKESDRGITTNVELALTQSHDRLALERAIVDLEQEEIVVLHKTHKAGAGHQYLDHTYSISQRWRLPEVTADLPVPLVKEATDLQIVPKDRLLPSRPLHAQQQTSHPRPILRTLKESIGADPQALIEVSLTQKVLVVRRALIALEPRLEHKQLPKV